MEDLLQALGLTGIDTHALAGGARESRVSRICKELDEVVEPFRNRPLEGQYLFVWLDALYLKVRHNHRIQSSCTNSRESGAGDCYRGAGERGAGDAGLRFGSQ